MNKRNLKSTILAVAMVVVMSIGGIMAYFTDFEEVTNNFTYGDIEITLTEPKWDTVKDTANQIVPNESFLKDPTVTNSSTLENAAYVFVEVEIPYANIITANLDGSRNAVADTELFFIDEDHFASDKWVELTGTINGVVYPTKDTTKKTVTHLFAYATGAEGAEVCTRLEKGQTATPFTEVTVCNAIESQGLENLDVQIDVRSYAIQAENLNVDTEGQNKPEGIAAARDVWTIILNQGTTVDVDNDDAIFVNGMLKAGTYRFNDVLTQPSKDIKQDIKYIASCVYDGAVIDGSFSQMSVFLNGTSSFFLASHAGNVSCTQERDSLFEVQLDASNWVLFYDNTNAWTGTLISITGVEKYAGFGQTITITEDTEVSNDFGEWFESNVTK